MTAALLEFLASAAVITAAAIFLTKSADALSDLTGLGRVLVGSIFLASATSLPELLVDISAIRQGTPDLAVGDLMGSSLFNLLILALADLIHRQPSRIFTRDAISHALPGVLSIVMATLAGIGIFTGRQLGAVEIGGVGLFPIAIVVAYVFGIRLIFVERRQASAAGEEAASLFGPSEKRKKLVVAFTGYLGSATVILIAAPYLAGSADKIATISGLGTTFMGTTLVAFSTSLPELVSTLSAVRMGAIDLAIGNIYGSNAFNMIMLAPLDFVQNGPLLASVSTTHVLTCLSMILMTTVALMGQLYQGKPRRRFIEPDAWLVFILGIGALWLVYLFH